MFTCSINYIMGLIFFNIMKSLYMSMNRCQSSPWKTNQTWILFQSMTDIKQKKKKPQPYPCSNVSVQLSAKYDSAFVLCNVIFFIYQSFSKLFL